MQSIPEKIQDLQKKLSEKGVYDVRFLVLIGVAIIAVSVFWNGAKIVQQNYELGQKVAEIEKENEILEIENRNKELQNEYLKTDEFADITARRVYGRAAPGESVYIVPKDVALNALSEPPQTEDIVAETIKPQWQQNLEAWMNLYFGS